MRCPNCRNKLLQKSGTVTRVRIRGALEVGDDGVCKAECYWCRQSVEIPLTLQKADVDSETFVMRIPGRGA